MSEDRMILVNFVDMHRVIKGYIWKVGPRRTAHINTKYKTMDMKVRPIAAPLPEDSLECMKGVTTNPSL